MYILRELANKPFNFLEFPSEVSDGAESPIPCLHFQIWYGKPEETKNWFRIKEDEEEKMKPKAERI